jgi:hypothetical protein
MAREKIDPNIGQIGLRNQVQKAGQYTVNAQATPKTNTALQFAQAMSRMPGIINQLGTLGELQAEEDLLELTNPAEVDKAMTNNDKGTMRILGYNRKYQEGVVAKYLTNNAPEFAKVWDGYANDEAMLGKDPQELVEAMDAKKSEFMDGLLNDFGGNKGRERAIRALGTAVVDKLSTSTEAKIIQNQEAQSMMFLDANFANNVGSESMTIKESLDLYRTELSEMQVHSSKEIKEKMIGTVESYVETLVQNKEYDKAEEVINNSSVYQLYGSKDPNKPGATLGGAVADKKRFGVLSDSIQTAKDKDDDEFSDNSKGVRRDVLLGIENIVNPDVDANGYKTGLERVLVRAGYTQEEAESETASIEGKHDIKGFISWYSALANKETNEVKRDLLTDQLGIVRKTEKEYFSGGAATIGTFTTDELATLENDMREYMTSNPNQSSSILNYPNSVNGRRMSSADPDYLDLVKKISNEFRWASSDTQMQPIVLATQRNILTDPSIKAGGFGLEYSTEIRSTLQEEAASLWSQSSGDVNIFNEKIAARATELQGQFIKEAETRSSLDAIYDNDLTAEMTNDALKLIKSEGKGNMEPSDGFKSFGRDFRSSSNMSGFGENPKGYQRFIDIISTDRKNIAGTNLKDKDKVRATRAHLLTYGFQDMSQFDISILADNGVGFGDIPLGQRVRTALDDGLGAFQARDAGEDLTTEQQQSLKTFEDFGFDGVDDFNTILEAQRVRISLRNR